jgi:hypothetical protein
MCKVMYGTQVFRNIRGDCFVAALLAMTSTMVIASEAKQSQDNACSPRLPE